MAHVLTLVSSEIMWATRLGNFSNNFGVPLY